MSKRMGIRDFSLDHVSFAYENAAPIFHEVTFRMPSARAVWVRSPGGRGKSTLLKIMAGLLRPQAGRYLINGEDVCQMTFEQFLNYRLNIGYSFDMGGLLNNKTVTENLTLPLQYHKLIEAEEIHDRVNDVIGLFGMDHVRDQRPFAIPGSQRKLTCLIRAFIHWPQVVFLDDPVTGLKQDNLNDLLHYINDGFANRGLKQMFFTSESSDFAQKFNAEELLISPDWFTARSVA